MPVQSVHHRHPVPPGDRIGRAGAGVSAGRHTGRQARQVDDRPGARRLRGRRNGRVAGRVAGATGRCGLRPTGHQPRRQTAEDAGDARGVESEARGAAAASGAGGGSPLVRSVILRIARPIGGAERHGARAADRHGAAGVYEPVAGALELADVVLEPPDQAADAGDGRRSERGTSAAGGRRGSAHRPRRRIPVREERHSRSSKRDGSALAEIR